MVRDNLLLPTLCVVLVVLYQPVESLVVRGIRCSPCAHTISTYDDRRRKTISPVRAVSTTTSLSMSSDGTAASLSNELDIDGTISSWARLVSAIPKKRDDLDRKILSTALPTMLNLMVVPLVSALYCVCVVISISPNCNLFIVL